MEIILKEPYNIIMYAVLKKYVKTHTFKENQMRLKSSEPVL